MKALFRISEVIFVLLFLLTLNACNKSDPIGSSEPVINPFSNGGTERNMIVVLSDMHLGADLTYSQCVNNRGSLAKLLQQIKAAPNVKELVIAGDLIDEWWVPCDVNTYQGSNQSNLVQRIAAANSEVFTVINQIIQENKIIVTFLPGNHDMGITAANVNLILPGINQVHDAQGVGTYNPASMPVLAIEHGNRYNFITAPDPISNIDSVPGSFYPTAYFSTRIATTHAIQNCTIPGDTLPVITPNTGGNQSQTLAYYYWQTWVETIEVIPITNRFSDKIIVTNINGFTKTYSVNDLVPFQLIPGGFIDMNLFRGVQDNWEARQTMNLVAVHTPIAQALANQFNFNTIDSQAHTQYFSNPNSIKRIVVFGHTHIAKIIPFTYNGVKSIYANSGTWLDNNPGSTMNFVVITPQSAEASSKTLVKLYNFMNEVVTKMDENSLRY
ncbi:MAG: metallophosphoesterase [Ignavibacteriae bacterium]|nr:metallophosphoesterase [Ignavibacteriota bacterium]